MNSPVISRWEAPPQKAASPKPWTRCPWDRDRIIDTGEINSLDREQLAELHDHLIRQITNIEATMIQDGLADHGKSYRLRMLRRFEVACSARLKDLREITDLTDTEYIRKLLVVYKKAPQAGKNAIAREVCGRLIKLLKAT